MSIKESAKKYYSQRYFITLQEYFTRNNITDADIQKSIQLEVMNIKKEEEQTEKLIDKLLKSCKAFKFIESNNKNNYMIYSKSIKENGFQLTFFYKDEPISDIIRHSIPEIKEEIISYINRYNQIDTAIGKLI